MSKLEIGTTYQHLRTQGLYTLSEVLPIKISGEWIQEGAVIYTSTATGQRYVRLKENFEMDFKREEGVANSVKGE